jgi:hypothetical protein
LLAEQDFGAAHIAERLAARHRESGQLAKTQLQAPIAQRGDSSDPRSE